LSVKPLFLYVYLSGVLLHAVFYCRNLPQLTDCCLINIRLVLYDFSNMENIGEIVPLLCFFPALLGKLICGANISMSNTDKSNLLYITLRALTGLERFPFRQIFMIYHLITYISASFLWTSHVLLPAAVRPQALCFD